VALLDRPGPRGAALAIRPLASADTDELVAFVRRNRDFLAPWEPRRGGRWFTLEGQRARADEAEAARSARAGYAFAITLDGALIGVVELSGVMRGPFRSTHLGYALDEGHGGRGLATRAVAMAVDFAFAEAGLHRVEAAVMPTNARSLGLLARLGFRREGLAERYLEIDGAWRDHVILAVTVEEWARP
jgi:ribosomal-protein-alanine N-acetyltransferase